MVAQGKSETAIGIETVGMDTIPLVDRPGPVAVISMGLQQELTIELLLRICHPGSVGKT